MWLRTGGQLMPEDPVAENTARPPAGAMKRGALLEVLRELLAARRTGVLRFQRQDEQRSLRFVNGEVVSGSPGPEGRLGAILSQCGLISSKDLAAAVAQAQLLGHRLGPTICQMGFVARDRIEEALRLQIRDVLFAVLVWHDGSYLFLPDDGPTPGLEDVTFRVSTGHLLLEAVRGIVAPEIVTETLGNLDTPLGPVEFPPLQLQRVTLSPADGYVLSRVDGSLTIRQILDITPLPTEEVRRSLFALLSVGIIERRAPLAATARRKPAARSKASAAETAGSKPAPTPPAAHAPPAATSAEPALELARSPEELIREGEERLAKGELWEASVVLEEAVAGAEGKLAQRAQILLARAYSRSRSGGKGAEALLLSVIAKDDGCFDAHLELGRLYKEKGSALRASAAFRKALSIDPLHAGAAEELASLEGPTSGGLLGRLRARVR
jgi:hypothetical protein